MWKQDQDVASPITPAIQREQSSQAKSPADKTVTKVVMDLGKSVVIKGELSGSEDLTLYGQMEGSIKLSDHTLTIGPHADIKADITARVVAILGTVTGNVLAGEKIEIGPTCSVVGDITSPHLVIADGGCLRGRVEMPKVRSVR